MRLYEQWEIYDKTLSNIDTQENTPALLLYVAGIERT